MLSAYLILLIIVAAAAQSGSGESSSGAGEGSGESSGEGSGSTNMTEAPEGSAEVDAEGSCLSNRIFTSCYRKCEVCCDKDSDCDTIECGEPKCACTNGTALQSASDPQNGIGCIAIEDCKC